MRAHYLQHVPFEGLGSIEGWLERSGYEITCTPFYENPVLPDVDDIDFLVVMGGPMSIRDEEDYPWLRDEKLFIKKAVEAGKPVLGICLGAQLIAGAMGGEIFPNRIKEIGWFPVRASDVPERRSFFRFPEMTEVFHWHGETFTLPQGAVRIAESDGCRNQAFQLGDNVIGLQFHLETTPESARAIVENCRDELSEAEFVQTESEILSASPEKYEMINLLMEQVLAWLDPV